MAKETISEIDYRLTEIIQSKKWKERKVKKFNRTSELWKNTKECVYTTCTTGVPGKQKEISTEKIFEEIMVENFPILEKLKIIYIAERTLKDMKTVCQRNFTLHSCSLQYYSR